MSDKNKAPDATNKEPGQDPNNPAPVLDTSGNPPVEPEPEGGGPAEGEGDDDKVDLATFNKLKREKQAANREAQTAKNRLAKLEAAEDKRKTEAMNDQEKATARAEKAEAALAENTELTAGLERDNIAIKAGVGTDYVDYISGELKKAKAASSNGDFDPDAWLKEQKGRTPMFFSDFVQANAPGSAGGAPGPQGGGELATEVAELETKLEGARSSEERMYIKRHIRKLKAQAATGG